MTAQRGTFLAPFAGAIAATLENGECSAAQLRASVQRRFGHKRTMSMHERSFYQTLNRMCRTGLIAKTKKTKSGYGPRNVPYRLTAKGRKELGRVRRVYATELESTR